MPLCQTWEEPALGNIFVRKMYFEKKGDVMMNHTHNFDHTSIVFKGSVRVNYIKDGEKKERIVSAPKMGKGKPTDRGEGYVLVPKEQEHELTSLEDDTEVWCTFAHRDHDGEIIPEYKGNTEAYS